MTTPKKPPGRPRKPVGEKYAHTARQLGRIPDDIWDRLKSTAESLGLKFSGVTGWAVAVLIREADRIDAERAAPPAKRRAKK